MNKKIFAAFFSTVLLCSCGKGGTAEISEAETESVTVTSAVASETAVTTASKPTTSETGFAAEKSSPKNTDTQSEETTATEHTAEVYTSVATSAIKPETITASQTITVQTEETTEQNKTTTTIKDEIKELYKVPEIVFIFSHEYYTPNCFGFYITNEGLIKSFDFREISPDAYCYVGDINVYNTLEDIGIDTDFDPVPKETLSELFELLLNIADDNKYNSYSADPYGFEANGKYGFFAARFSEHNEIQIIPLGEYGDFNGENSDKNANELFNKLKLLFPDPHEYLY